MTAKFLNYDLIQSFPSEQFKSKQPFPWFDFHQFLTAEGFQILYDTYPSLAMFEKHVGIERVYGQRPHDRYYLAYESSVYHGSDKKGVVKHQDLPEPWQAFIEELETSQDYHEFICDLVGVREFEIRYAWHMGMTSSEVSPHLDGPDKISTHIFYFNTSQDWNLDWGGAILALGSKSTNSMNPDFTEFAEAEAVQITDNHSFLFQNTPSAWHGVKPLTCPEGYYRRLFNVIFEVPDARSSTHSAQTSLLYLMRRIRAKSAASK